MLGMTIVICIFLFLITALILNTIDKKQEINSDLLDILENLNERLKILEKRIKKDTYFYKGENNEKTI